MHVGVRHGAGADHAPFPFRPQGIFQQLRRVALHLDILERMGELVAPAPAVAVNTAVGAAPVDVHAAPSPAAGQYSLGIHKMHDRPLLHRQYLIFARASYINDCPPNPGSTDITKTKSKLGKNLSKTLTSVFGLIDKPALPPF